MHHTHFFNFPITCSCGRAYSRDNWMTLANDGIQSGYHEGKHRHIFEDLEMRRCACGSTLSVPVSLIDRKGRRVPVILHCGNCGSRQVAVRSPLTGTEYCLKCGAEVSGGRSGQGERGKNADKNGT